MPLFFTDSVIPRAMTSSASHSNTPKSVSYKDAGVDLELYEQAMERLPAMMKKTHTPRVMDLPGGFAGLFRLDSSPEFKRNYKQPVLVSGTDGVGTKLKIAIQAGIFNTVGIDLVAMSVNDTLCLGAEPLFFLDYLALGKDNPDLIAQLVEGVAEGCRQAGAALMGGETAIMPDIYAEGDFDMAGFCVAVAEKDRLIDGKRIQPGDVAIGIASSGPHSNGYSLIRKVVFEISGLKVTDYVDELQQTVGEALLTPTKIYTKQIVELLQRPGAAEGISGLAHITGGGIADNLVRIFPENCCLKIDSSSWNRLAVFDWLQRLGNVKTDEMYRVFNMGIGFVVLTRPEFATQARQFLDGCGLKNFVLGEVADGPQGVQVV